MGVKDVAEAAKAAKPEVVKPEAKPDHPLVTSFAVIKKGKNWVALAMRSRGREIVDEMILDQDDFRRVAQDAAGRASMESWMWDIDPFEKKED